MTDDQPCQLLSSVCHYATPLFCYIMQDSADLDVHRMMNMYRIIGFLPLYSRLFKMTFHIYVLFMLIYEECTFQKWNVGFNLNFEEIDSNLGGD